MAEANDSRDAPAACAALVFFLVGGYVGHEAADACVVAWWQSWGEGWVAEFGAVAGGALGMVLGFALVYSLRDAFALVRSAPPSDGGEERPPKAHVLYLGLVALALLATLGALAVVGLGGLGWREVSPPGGGFRVVMPGEPIEQDEGENTPQGRATGKRFLCRGPEQGYMLARVHVYGVSFLDYPPRFVARNAPEVIFKEQRDAVVPSEGELVSEKVISLDGFPGTEMRVATRDGQMMTCRMFLVRQRLYLVLVKHPKNGYSPGVDTFFDSFALTGG